jgi:hypothetical protein
MLRDTSYLYRIGRYLDGQKYIQVLNNRSKFEKAKFWFWPIVFGCTIFFGFINGIKGAFVGFMYGIVAGLFLIHESLDEKKR